jgi:hypothetical protein
MSLLSLHSVAVFRCILEGILLLQCGDEIWWRWKWDWTEMDGFE